MKKSTKGTAAIAVGAALLLSLSGGSLAYWNVSQSADAGVIIAGDLNLAANGAGTWKDRNGQDIDINTYKVVPGDKLTFTQDLTVTLIGDKLEANLTSSPLTGSGTFKPENVKSEITLKDAEGNSVSNPLKSSTDNGKKLSAAISFEFLSSTPNRDSVNATYDFNSVSFNLQQVQRDGLQ